MRTNSSDQTLPLPTDSPLPLLLPPFSIILPLKTLCVRTTFGGAAQNRGDRGRKGLFIREREEGGGEGDGESGEEDEGWGGMRSNSITPLPIPSLAEGGDEGRRERKGFGGLLDDGSRDGND